MSLRRVSTVFLLIPFLISGCGQESNSPQTSQIESPLAADSSTPAPANSEDESSITNHLDRERSFMEESSA